MPFCFAGVALRDILKCLRSVKSRPLYQAQYSCKVRQMISIFHGRRNTLEVSMFILAWQPST